MENVKHKVLALKYRPQTFEDLIGQKTAAETIINSIKINKTGVNEKTTNEGIIAPFVFTVMSAILIYGLSDRIYT